MPYATNEALPPAVKDNLPTSAQNVWRNAFNSAFEKNKDDGQASQIAWGALKNAGWEKDDSGNWKKMNAELKDIEIFSVGTWKDETFTEEDLDEIVKNFYELKDRIKPPLKLAHKNNMHTQDGQPALGWTTELKRIGKKLVASFSDVPNIVKEALTKKLYKRVSSEIYPNLSIGGKKYKRALAGVGLLGADIPEVKDLQDIEILFADSGLIKKYESDVINGVITFNEDNDMSDELKKQYDERIKLIEEKFDGFKADLTKKFTEEIDVVKKENETLKAELAQRNKNQKVTEFKMFCEKAVADGKMMPAARDILIADIEKLEFSEGQDFSIPLEKFQAYMEKTKEILDKSERGTHFSEDERTRRSQHAPTTHRSGTVLHDTDLDAEVRKYMREHKTTDYSEAMRDVLSMNPDLAEKFMESGVEIKEGRANGN